MPQKNDHFCPHCKEKINKDAKKCKHCGADLRNWFAKHPIWTGILAFMLLSWLVGTLSDSVGNKSVSNIKNALSSPIEVVSTTTKVTEKNTVWWKYAWQVTLKNPNQNIKTVNIKIKWMDAENFVVDDDYAYNLTIEPNEKKTFNDFQLIDASVAPNIKTVTAEIQ